MADTKISAMTDAGALDGTEQIVLVQGGSNKKTTFATRIKTYNDALYQAALVSGTNIKTINGSSVLGSGDLTVSGSDARVATGANYVNPTAAGDRAQAIGTDATAAGQFGASYGRSADATGARSLALGADTTAGSDYSSAVGLNSAGSGSVTATGSGAMALGGSYASGQDSLAAAIGDNTSTYGATGANSIAIGYQSKATNPTGAAVAIGYSAQATGAYSYAMGRDVVADNNACWATGYQSRTFAISGRSAFAFGSFGTQGDAQTNKLLLRAQTTTASVTAVTSDQGAAGANNQLVLQNDSTVAFTALIVARRTDADNESAGYLIQGVADRNGSAGTTALVGTPIVTVLGEDTAAWDAVAVADTTNGAVKFNVTGEASKTIRWVCTVWYSEVQG